MRRVARLPTPKSLDGVGSIGDKELVKARAFFKVKENGEKSFTFAAYKADDVRAAMEAMFGGKSAYCETFFAAAMPVDVEHYRPKGAFIEGGKPKKPGYWWLAMVWTNLLPSCADCNRAREQEIIGADGKSVAGKANQFPLATGSLRAAAEGGEAREVALLLDPCVDDPAAHLEFGSNGTVRPALVGGADSERGKVTIDVAALMRRALVEARAVAARETQAAIRHVRDTMHDIAEAESQAMSEEARRLRLETLRRRLDLDVADMEAKAAPTTAYSAVAETLVAAFKSEKGL